MMKNDCDIFKDLLPLYLDDVCSESSCKYIEDHVKECENCRSMLQELKNDLPEQTVNTTKKNDALKRTSVQLNKTAYNCIFGIIAIFIYLLIFLWQENLADQGDYSYFSYSFHELCSSFFMFVLLITGGWFISVLVRMIKRRSWRKNILLALVLALLLYMQGRYLYQKSYVLTTTVCTEVVEIPDECHFVIKNGDGIVTIKTIPVVTSLLRTDGTGYGFSYEYDSRTPDQGKLMQITIVIPAV